MSIMSLQTPLILLLHWSFTFLVGVGGVPAIPTDAAQIYLPLIREQSPVIVIPSSGIWIADEQLAALPTTGPAWEQLQETADQVASPPNLGDQDSDANVQILAKALVFARTGEEKYRTEVGDALALITANNTEDAGRTLALGRELAAYVMAADLINLADYNPGLDVQFRAKLRGLLTKPLEGWSGPKTLQQTHELRPNNWGTHAGASRVAVALYLGDKAELERSARVFFGYLGNLAAYNGFEYAEDLSWQANPGQPTGLNPAGAAKAGYPIDGALPEEMRRGGAFQWPPLPTNYPWEALQGAVVQATLLQRAGYPVWEWENRALLRSVQFLYNIGWTAEGDDEWITPLINCFYATSFPVASQVQAGKNMGWTDWTHAQCP